MTFPEVAIYRLYDPKRVPKQLCLETVRSRSGYVPKRSCPETAMPRSGYVPKRSCPEVAMSRNGHVPKRLCPETVVSRNGYVPKRLCQRMTLGDNRGCFHCVVLAILPSIQRYLTMCNIYCIHNNASVDVYYVPDCLHGMFWYEKKCKKL